MADESFPDGATESGPIRDLLSDASGSDLIRLVADLGLPLLAGYLTGGRAGFVVELLGVVTGEYRDGEEIDVAAVADALRGNRDEVDVGQVLDTLHRIEREESEAHLREDLEAPAAADPVVRGAATLMTALSEALNDYLEKHGGEAGAIFRGGEPSVRAEPVEE